jgi:hypothetical protein
MKFTKSLRKKGKQVHMQCPLKPDPTPLTSLDLSADLLAIELDDDSAKGSQAGPATIKSIIKSVHDPGAHACEADFLQTPLLISNVLLSVIQTLRLLLTCQLIHLPSSWMTTQRKEAKLVLPLLEVSLNQFMTQVLMHVTRNFFELLLLVPNALLSLIQPL